jgi:hypothetical protein
MTNDTAVINEIVKRTVMEQLQSLVQVISRVGQNRKATPYMTVRMVIPELKIPCKHRVNVCKYGSGQPYLYRSLEMDNTFALQTKPHLGCIDGAQVEALAQARGVVRMVVRLCNIDEMYCLSRLFRACSRCPFYHRLALP